MDAEENANGYGSKRQWMSSDRLGSGRKGLIRREREWVDVMRICCENSPRELGIAVALSLPAKSSIDIRWVPPTTAFLIRLRQHMSPPPLRWRSNGEFKDNHGGHTISVFLSPAILARNFTASLKTARCDSQTRRKSPHLSCALHPSLIRTACGGAMGTGQILVDRVWSRGQLCASIG
jgi:hypothetical protein